MSETEDYLLESEDYLKYLPALPSWYEGTPIGIPLSVSMDFSYSTDKPIPTLLFENVTDGEIKKDLTGLSIPFTYSIP